MDDYKTELLERIQMVIGPTLERDTAAYIISAITVQLNDYEVTRRTTEVAVLDNTNDELIKRYAACLMIEGKAKGTIIQYGRSLKRLAEFSGKNLPDVNHNDIRAWLAQLKIKGAKNSTIGNQRNNVLPFFKWMFNEQIIERNPGDMIKPIKKPKENKKAFSEEDIDAIRSVCEGKKRAVVEFLLATGVRVNELCNLTIEDVDFDAMTVRVRMGKGGKDRQTYMTPIAKKYLVKYLETRKDNRTPLFVNRYGNTLTTGGVRALLADVGRKSGVENVHPHRFRRTLATTLSKRGMPIQEIQRILGHTNISTTQVYIETENSRTQAAYRQYAA